ncbi:MAG TPA: ChuX/HutX family heme-like substrate-binding protein [Chthoniobacteraceae bacterium]|nr:ChuX/HutX family heme-like substrate-binding protein [Chthoniobacteraceae bacterium]
MNTDIEDLRNLCHHLLTRQPGLRIRDAAYELGTSEAALLAAGCGGEVTRLEGDWKGLLRELPRLGRVMCVTRNDVCLHERHGNFEQIDFYGEIGVVLGSEIDLRLFMEHWHYGFAVIRTAGERAGRSFRFFDACGVAVFEVYLQEEGAADVYHELVDRFRADDQAGPVVIAPAELEGERHDVDIAAFREEWLALEDTAYFADLLKEFGLRREQALRLAPEGYTRRVEVGAIQTLLEAVAARQLRIMIFIRSPGCLQIHAGIIRAIRILQDQWLDIAEPDFHCHLCLPLVASAWVVRKPTLDGVITSLELFDADGNNIALFFAKRGQGQSEDRQWRRMLSEVPSP